MDSASHDNSGAPYRGEPKRKRRRTGRERLERESRKMHGEALDLARALDHSAGERQSARVAGNKSDVETTTTELSGLYGERLALQRRIYAKAPEHDPANRRRGGSAR